MHNFFTLDVFADAPLKGNPLAVVLEAEDLDDKTMQAIAREFNLSETVFVLPAEDKRHRARLRIFTPVQELAFAGHPLVGTASLLALLDPHPTDDVAFSLEIAAGVVPFAVETQGEDRAFARFRAPKTPVLSGEAASAADLAAALGLEAGAIGLGPHRPTRSDSGGSIFQTVPVASLEDLAAAKPTGEAFERAFGSDLCFVYTSAHANDGADWRARMFAPHVGVPEDPATGSAAVAFAAALSGFSVHGDGAHDIVIVQGVEMGRPSRIALQMRIENGRLDHVEIGGRAVIASEGELHV